MSYHINKPKKYIPKIAERDLNPSNDEEDLDVNRPLTADFITLQHATPPAIHGLEPNSHNVGVGRASKIGQLLKDPYYKRPKPARKNKQGSKKKSNILANFPRIKKEIDKEALKQQEKQISDAFVKPLSNKGIKVNNLKVIYRK